MQTLAKLIGLFVVVMLDHGIAHADLININGARRFGSLTVGTGPAFSVDTSGNTSANSLTVGTGGSGGATITENGTSVFDFKLGGAGAFRFKDSSNNVMLQFGNAGSDTIFHFAQTQIQAPSVLSGTNSQGWADILANRSYTGSITGGGNPVPLLLAKIITDNVDTAVGSVALDAIDVTMSSGTGSKGIRYVDNVSFILNGPSLNTSIGGTYVTVNATCKMASADNGTALVEGSAKGACWAQDLYSIATGSATNISGLVGTEIDMYAQSGSSMLNMFGAVVSFADTSGTVAQVSAAFDATSSSSTVGFSYGLLFGNYDGNNPVGNSGTYIGAYPHGGSGAINVGYGVDFSNVTFSGDAFKSVGFTVDPSGNVVSPSYQTSTALITATNGSSTAAFTANMIAATGGPTTTAQNGWVKMKDSSGATIWVPEWK